MDVSSVLDVSEDVGVSVGRSDVGATVGAVFSLAAGDASVPALSPPGVSPPGVVPASVPGVVPASVDDPSDELDLSLPPPRRLPTMSTPPLIISVGIPVAPEMAGASVLIPFFRKFPIPPPSISPRACGCTFLTVGSFK